MKRAFLIALFVSSHAFAGSMTITGKDTSGAQCEATFSNPDSMSTPAQPIQFTKQTTVDVPSGGVLSEFFRIETNVQAKFDRVKSVVPQFSYQQWLSSKEPFVLATTNYEDGYLNGMKIRREYRGELSVDAIGHPTQFKISVSRKEGHTEGCSPCDPLDDHCDCTTGYYDVYGPATIEAEEGCRFN